MIETVQSKIGLPVLKKSGRFLGSSVDPRKEASDWVSARAASFSGSDAAVVLGLGSGYHVVEACSRFPGVEILVFEPDPEVAARASEIQPCLGPSRIVGAEDPLSDPRIQALLDKVYSVTRHAPSFQLERDRLARAEELLLARTPESLKRHLEIRADLAKAFNSGRLGRLDPRTPVSIHEVLGSLAAPGTGDPSDAVIWRALGELVL